VYDTYRYVDLARSRHGLTTLESLSKPFAAGVASLQAFRCEKEREEEREREKESGRGRERERGRKSGVASLQAFRVACVCVCV